MPFRQRLIALRDRLDRLRWPQNMVRMALITMRCVPVLTMLVLLLGAAPALAQESPGIIPQPGPPAARPATQKPAAKHAAPQAVAAKPAVPRLPLPKPDAAKAESAPPATLKASEAKPTEAKPASAGLAS